MAIGFRCQHCRAVFRDLGQLFDHAEHAHGVVIAEATPEPLTNAERCKLTRQRRIEHDPEFHERERERVAAVRAGHGTAPPVAPSVAPSPEAAPGARVAALAAEWDAASARRTSERKLRRAERRRMA